MIHVHLIISAYIGLHPILVDIVLWFSSLDHTLSKTSSFSTVSPTFKQAFIWLSAPQEQKV